MLPEDLRTALPSWVAPALSILILVLGIAGRLIDQGSGDALTDQDGNATR